MRRALPLVHAGTTIITGEMPSNTFDSITAAYVEDAQVRQSVYACAMRAVDTYK